MVTPDRGCRRDAEVVTVAAVAGAVAFVGGPAVVAVVHCSCRGGDGGGSLGWALLAPLSLVEGWWLAPGWGAQRSSSNGVPTGWMSMVGSTAGVVDTARGGDIWAEPHGCLNARLLLKV